MQNNINKENIEFMLLEGEGQYLEYKEKIDKKFIQEIIAFANAAGGKILLGVRDDASICGIKLDNKLKSQIQDACRNCDPRIFVDIDSYKNIVIIDINEGIDKPYSC